MVATNAQHVAQLKGGVIMRYFIAALGLMVALTFGHVASAADSGWDNGSNGYGQYHVSNG